jgi:hypothetical protein
VTVEKMDLFDFCAPAFKFAMQKMFQLLTQSLAGQHTLGFLYDSGDGANTKPKLQRAVEDWCSLGLLEEIARFRPDCVVATHFLPSQLVATLKRKSAVLGSRLNLKLVITDLDVQSMWVVPGAVDTYFVPREDAKTVLSTYLDKGRVMRSEAKGRRRYSKLSASENVVVSGIPIATRFARAAEIAKETGGRAKAMEMFGLDPGDKRPVVVLMSGGKIVQEVMESALGAEAGIRLIVVTGRQADVRAQLEAVPVPARHEVTLLGFCKEMPSLLLAADLMVGKCGGLTVAENAALGVRRQQLPATSRRHANSCSHRYPSSSSTRSPDRSRGTRTSCWKRGRSSATTCAWWGRGWTPCSTGGGGGGGRRSWSGCARGSGSWRTRARRTRWRTILWSDGE